MPDQIDVVDPTANSFETGATPIPGGSAGVPTSNEVQVPVHASDTPTTAESSSTAQGGVIQSEPGVNQEHRPAARFVDLDTIDSDSERALDAYIRAVDLRPHSEPDHPVRHGNLPSAFDHDHEAFAGIVVGIVARSVTPRISGIEEEALDMLPGLAQAYMISTFEGESSKNSVAE